jgi:hypothetical protein
MKRFLAVSAFLLTPVLVSAQNLDSVILKISDLINLLIPLVIALAILAFFWGLMKYIFSASDEEKKAEGRNIMIYGVIALFVMVSVWGLVRLLQNTFGITQNTPIIPGQIR